MEVDRENVSSRQRLRLSAECTTDILYLWSAISFLGTKGCPSMNLFVARHWNSTYMQLATTPKPSSSAARCFNGTSVSILVHADNNCRRFSEKDEPIRSFLDGGPL